MKIAILGYTGAGKSTLARRIGEKYDIPVLHLDKVNYTKNWKIRDIHESKEIVEDFLKKWQRKVPLVRPPYKRNDG